ncbi:hypothetical protein PILCRDRAFT_814394 [Piloderma croceum F 1598]|uniref:Uncharacterized protein n=1 Tax=Piloderma croceum (strain F 1598) TaxID=765440 RepID=A0A0C3GCX3_PILCF|nr:hypothetical protein PILCRDRAFT_814394 [Piloderma croceum F 1598]
MLSESPMNDSDRMSILAHSGPAGYTANEPIVLVYNLSCARVSRSSRPQINRNVEQGPTPLEMRYREWYHRLSRWLIALTSCHGPSAVESKQLTPTTPLSAASAYTL